MIQPEIPHTSPSYMISYQMDKDLCDRIVEDFDSRENRATVDKLRGYSRLNNQSMDQDLMTEYISDLEKVFQEYRKEYKWSYVMGTSWSFFPPFNLQKYYPGDSYSPTHIEEGGPREGKIQRILAFTTYLNDIEVGGETEFIYQGIKVKPKKGLTIIWPAGWTHPHHGLPAPEETKYIATGWAGYHFRNKE